MAALTSDSDHRKMRKFHGLGKVGNVFQILKLVKLAIEMMPPEFPCVQHIFSALTSP